jgi:Uma2 family endonuclease
MNWSQVLKDSTLNDLPYKIELDKWGQVIMTPASNKHGNYQIRIGTKLSLLKKEGEVISECSIQTREGVKVADIAWCSPQFIKKHSFRTPFTRAPEICVEIISPSNSKQALAEKMQLYFEHGATEVWVCDNQGAISFYGITEKLPRSKLVRKFPKVI